MVEVTDFGTGAENDTFVTSGTGARGLIVNDDSAVFVSDSKPITQKEGTILPDQTPQESDYQYYEFDVVRAGPFGGTSMVDWALVLNGTATADDFLGVTSGSLTFNANGTQTVRIKLNPDFEREVSESFYIQLSNSSGGVSIVNSTENVGPLEIAKIGDDDYSLRIVQTEVAQETDGRTNIAFTVTRDGDSDLATMCRWSVSFGTDGMAASAADFRDTNDGVNDGVITGEFLFPAGIDSYTIYVPVQGDTQWEENEEFTMTLGFDQGTPTAREVTAQGVITNDDEGFSIRVIDPVAEAAGQLTFTVVRQGDLTGSSSVNWVLTAGELNPVSLSGANADMSGDFSGTVEFDGTETATLGANGQYYVEKTVTIAINDDNTYERDEQFVVTLTSPSEGSSLRQDAKTQTGTIKNDDLAYWLTADKTDVVEGDAGVPVTVVTYTLHRTGSTETLANSSSVNWRLSVVGGDTAAMQSSDVVGGLLSGSATFDANATETTLTVQLKADDIKENDATVRMTLTGVGSFLQGDVLGNSSTVDFTLRDDDDQVTLTAGQATTVNALAPNEGNVNSDGDLTNDYTSYFFNVNRVGSTIGAATVKWAVTTGSGHSVDASDIDSIWVNGVMAVDVDINDAVFGNGLIEFAEGDNALREIEVRIKHDRRGEYDEDFTVVLSEPSFGTVLPTTSISQAITNDDPVLTLTMDETEIIEGNVDDDRAIVFTVTRSGDTSIISTVDWAVSTDGGSGTVNENDFGGFLPGGTVTFLEGESVKYVTLLTQGDNTFEEAERFTINLRNAQNADILGDTSVEATVLNDDVGLEVFAIDESLMEGATGDVTEFRFGLRAEGASAAARATVRWHVEGVGMNPANRDDFVGGVLPSGTTSMLFRNGVGTGTLTVDIAGDNVFGSSEDFKVVIDSFDVFDSRNIPLGGSVVVSEATATTLDDDRLIGFDQTPVVVREGDDDVTELRFYVDSLQEGQDSPSMDNIWVDWSISGEANSADFVSTTGSGLLNYDDENGRYYVAVEVNGDAQVEPNERFVLSLTGAYDVNSNGNVEVAEQGSSAVGSISGDDYGLFLVTPSAQQDEDVARFVFDVMRDGPTNESMDVQVRIGVPFNLGGNDGASVSDFVMPEGFYEDGEGYIVGDLHFNAEETVQRFTLEAVHDRTEENDERFTVEATVMLVNDEQPNVNAVTTYDGVLLTDDSAVYVSNPEPLLPEIPDHQALV
jgi:hypothetical protein